MYVCVMILATRRIMNYKRAGQHLKGDPLILEMGPSNPEHTQNERQLGCACTL